MFAVICRMIAIFLGRCPKGGRHDWRECKVIEKWGTFRKCRQCHKMQKYYHPNMLFDRSGWYDCED